MLGAEVEPVLVGGGLGGQVRLELAVTVLDQLPQQTLQAHRRGRQLREAGVRTPGVRAAYIPLTSIS